VTSLSQIAATAEPSSIAKIVELLRDLRGEIEKTRAADAAWEQEKREMWEKELADLTATRNHLTEKRN